MVKRIAFLTFLVNLVTTEKSVERLAAASDSHAALPFDRLRDQSCCHQLPNASRQNATNHIQNRCATLEKNIENDFKIYWVNDFHLLF